MQVNNLGRLLVPAGFILAALIVAGCKTAPQRYPDLPASEPPGETPVTLNKPLVSVRNTVQRKSELIARSITDGELKIVGSVLLPEESSTFCNRFVGDTLRKYFGDAVFSKVFPNGTVRFYTIKK